MDPIKIAIVEDDKVVRESLHTYLSDNLGIQINWISNSVEDFLLLLNSSSSELPDIVLLDIMLPGMSGIEGISWVLNKSPNSDIIMLTTMEDADSIFAALREGACSYISKRISLARIEEAVIQVSRGGSYMSPSIARKIAQYFNPKKAPHKGLTPRQRQIIQGIVKGNSYQQLADQLFISIDTVRSHIKKVYKILQINSKTELIRLSLKGEI